MYTKQVLNTKFADQAWYDNNKALNEYVLTSH